MHAIERDKKEMEDEKVKQRLVEEQGRSNQVQNGVQAGQDSAPPPTPAAALSPASSASLLARQDSNVSSSIKSVNISASYDFSGKGSQHMGAPANAMPKSISNHQAQMAVSSSRAQSKEDLERNANGSQ